MKQKDSRESSIQGEDLEGGPMTHDEFFEAAIDPGERHDAALRREVIQHRRECVDCRELERDYSKIMALGRLLPREVAPAKPDFVEELIAYAGECRDERQRATPRRPRFKHLLVAATLGGLFMTGQGRAREVGVESTSEPTRPIPRAEPERKPAAPPKEAEVFCEVPSRPRLNGSLSSEAVSRSVAPITSHRRERKRSSR